MVTSMDPVFRLLTSGDLLWMLTGSEGCGDLCRARSGSSLPFSLERSSRLPWSAFLSSFCHRETFHSALQPRGLCPCCSTPAPGLDLLLCQAQEALPVPAATLTNPNGHRHGTASKEASAAGPGRAGQRPSVPWGWQLLPRCLLTSAEAGRKPNPVGMFLSSSQPLTPGLKCSSTWKRSSEEGSCEHMGIGKEPNPVNPTISPGPHPAVLASTHPRPVLWRESRGNKHEQKGSRFVPSKRTAHSRGILTVAILGQQTQRSTTELGSIYIYIYIFIHTHPEPQPLLTRSCANPAHARTAEGWVPPEPSVRLFQDLSNFLC